MTSSRAEVPPILPMFVPPKERVRTEPVGLHNEAAIYTVTTPQKLVNVQHPRKFNAVRFPWHAKAKRERQRALQQRPHPPAWLQQRPRFTSRRGHQSVGSADAAVVRHAVRLAVHVVHAGN